jgi:hypothetical protein
VREKGEEKKTYSKRERRRICIPKAPNQRKKLHPFKCEAKPKRKNREIRKPKRERICVRERKGKQKKKEERKA